ncbi:phosphatidylinositol-glycan biosynthesis class X protein [Perognathus longimembris pacificus]|uniref:phosphatidylinositol-glycan biosynthesis class X protein n=1 Tax=Perognathus longimembris pacificus TaxID=214514 RepID=UPI002018B41F|nr:phosphatidylinositol-glycan biosynthesis class X protein [Perognathus longimembris pacificus]
MRNSSARTTVLIPPTREPPGGRGLHPISLHRASETSLRPSRAWRGRKRRRAAAGRSDGQSPCRRDGGVSLPARGLSLCAPDATNAASLALGSRMRGPRSRVPPRCCHGNHSPARLERVRYSSPRPQGGVAAVEPTLGRASGLESASRGAWRLWKLPAEKIRGAAGPRTGVRSPRAPLGRPRSGVLAALFVAIRAVAWLLVGLVGLAHTLASAFSEVPFFDGIRATCSEIVLRQEVLKDGFHRDLVVKVKFGESIEDLQTCRLLIKHYIPAGLFVDPYELASLREKNVTEAVMVSEHFNIEAPNYLSRESEILMYARKDVQCIDCFHSFLPVHYRYHRPHSKDGDTLIVINNPDLLMYCDQEFPVLKCWAQSKVAAPCAFKSKDICQWNSMKYKSILKNVTLHVPVGLTIHTSLVCSVTLLITILCSILILLAVFKYGHFFI